MKIYHGAKGEQVTMVDKQNKSKPVVCSPGYGSMTFWKNKDFWQSILLYVVCFGLFFALGYVASLMQ